MKNVFVLFTLLCISIYSTCQNKVTVPGDYPQQEAVIKDVKSSTEIINGLNSLGLKFNQNETLQIIDIISDKVDVPSTYPVNSAIYKVKIDYPKMADNNFKRVFVALKYTRPVTEKTTGKWSLKGCVSNLCSFDEAHIIDANGVDLTHQKRVEEQKQKDIEEKQKRDEKLKGANPANNESMINIAKLGTESKPSKFFGAAPASEIKNLNIIIPDDNKYMGKGNICSFICKINYEYQGQKIEKTFKIQGNRSNESENFKFLNAFEQ